MDIEKIVQAVLETLNSENNEKLLLNSIEEDFATDVLTKLNVPYDTIETSKNTCFCNYSKLVITNIDVSELHSISIGVPKGETSKLVLDFLLNGKEVILIDTALTFRRYQYTANNNLYSLYENYLETVKSFSVKVISESEFYYNIQGEKAPVVKEEQYKFSGNLLTEKEVQEAFNKKFDTIVVNKKCLVTSLAKDIAREYNISIVYMEV